MDIIYNPKPDVIVRSCTKSIGVFKQNSNVTYINFEDEYGIHNFSLLASFDSVHRLLKEPVVDLCSISMKNC